MSVFVSLRRLLLFSLLVSGTVAPLAAQSLPAKALAAPRGQFYKAKLDEPKLDGLVATPDLRSSALLPQIVGEKFVEARTVEDKIGTTAEDLPLRRRAYPLTSEQDDATCFYIRGYRVTRDDPESDATRLAGYSECQSSARFQTKTAVQVLEVGH